MDSANRHGAVVDALPVYNITHAIRLLVISRCETTLTWDQLRSPQISQFLVKPIQKQIRDSHFNRATIYALMANCLQFQKEVDSNPGNSGTNRTRAMVCELLALKLLKEFTTRELIDALSYEFFPLQGQTPPTSATAVPGAGWSSNSRSNPVAASPVRISCLEIAILAQAKRFLAHPLVVQQLEAIWAGTIVFHSAADRLHRKEAQGPQFSRDYGSFAQTKPFSNIWHSTKDPSENSSQGVEAPRRMVTLYDPRDASLFKLSRLRVPRYRNFLSTLSFAALLGLYLAVLVQRNLHITVLEVLFWFWSAGFILDELVCFNEQGFRLYLMSFWNVFDLGILLLLFCYCFLRIYGMMSPDRLQESIADQAYDILAANAVLLFPRLFSVLDHYKYFSQLLIAFRIMAGDLVAVCILIVVACSGFFIAFTFSFGAPNSPAEVAYALFQMLMGFTPAAWSLWEEYNTLGRIILTIFLFICHFVVVTILITVLTNSFMEIVRNAHEEHQFVFAVNTISMVKSDALFSYIAPTNILGWIITPLRYVMPFRQFVKLNRTIIKITHFPVLFSICFYEKVILSSSMFDRADLVNAGTRSGAVLRARRDRQNRFDALHRTNRFWRREPSIATHQQDQTLDEVFRKPFRHGSIYQSPDGRRKSIMVDNWMRNLGSVQPPEEDDPKEVEYLETRQRRPVSPSLRRRRFTAQSKNLTETTRSVASDPEEFIGHSRLRSVAEDVVMGHQPLSGQSLHVMKHTDAEGDDERTSDDNDDNDDGWGDDDRELSNRNPETGDPTPRASGKSTPKFYSSRSSTAVLRSRRNSPARRKAQRNSGGPSHQRNPSGMTMLYNPTTTASESEGGISPRNDRPHYHNRRGRRGNRFDTAPPTPGHRTPKRGGDHDDGLPPQSSTFMSAPDIPGMGLDLGGGLPSSLATQFLYPGGESGNSRDDRDMLNKLVLARMNNLEEGFREVIREVKDLRQGRSLGGSGATSTSGHT